MLLYLRILLTTVQLMVLSVINDEMLTVEFWNKFDNFHKRSKKVCCYEKWISSNL